MTTEERPIGVCPATTVLTEAEVQWMSELPDAELGVESSDPVECEFAAHGPEVLHAYMVQNQFDGTVEASWWLRWSDEGYRKIQVEPSCKGVSEGSSCLLVTDHPGECEDGIEDDDGDGWSLLYRFDDKDGWSWELHQGNRLLHFTDELDGTQLEKAQEWAASTLLDSEDTTVSGWTPDEGTPGRWTATLVQDGER